MSSTTADGVQTLTSGLTTLPRVNLLPPEVHQARKLRRTQICLVSGVAALAVLLGGVYFTQVSSADGAASDLSVVKAQGVTLNAQKAQYADVPTVLDAITNAENSRQSAMSTDVQWYRYLNDLSYITPKDAWLTSLQVTFNSGASSTNPLASAGIATVTVQGDALKHVDVASWLDAIAKEHGWADAYFSSSTKAVVDGHNVVQFASTVNVTPSALSHRYDRKAG
jgi:Tfp pilus assembly protein PilN